MWIETRFGCQRIIDDDLHATAQFEYAAGNNGLARLQTIDDINKITTRLSQTDKLLAQHFFNLTGLFVFLLRSEERRVGKEC